MTPPRFTDPPLDSPGPEVAPGVTAAVSTPQLCGWETPVVHEGNTEGGADA